MKKQLQSVIYLNFYERTNLKMKLNIDKEKYVVHLEVNDLCKAFSVKGSDLLVYSRE